MHAQSASERAAEAAKKYAGEEITITWEAGLQALDPKNFSIPKWEERTGVKVRVVELPVGEMFTKTMQEYRAGTGAYDVLNVVPAWMPDLAQAGALEPLGPFIDKYDYRADLEGIAPVYRNNWMTYQDKVYAIPDDGDQWMLFYRKDLFNDAENQRQFEQEYGYALEPPKTWDQFDDIARFFTDKYGPELHGAAMFGKPPYAQRTFQERFRVAGGRFFDPETMKATINTETGVEVLERMRAQVDYMPDGVQQWGFGELLSAFLKGNVAMVQSWPPFGRWAAGYGTDSEPLSWVPATQIAGKVGYAVPPGGASQMAVGFSLSVASNSDQKELAYLFIQWINSQEISLQRVQLPYALRDPFRESHYTDSEYKSRWDSAPEYLQTLKDSAAVGLLDLSIVQTAAYQEALQRGISRLWAGDDPQKILDDVAAEWNEITERVGVERQRKVYQDWASKPNAYP
ncbi:MAG: sugar ABC transporter substrate-binding protein [Halofilum sp. (in: g-proteobacteria)]|nr:sugar ABC transporter substrate-binding protein [Halofilum sp. (in: g-proteobacteria)]